MVLAKRATQVGSAVILGASILNGAGYLAEAALLTAASSVLLVLGVFIVAVGWALTAYFSKSTRQKFAKHCTNLDELSEARGNPEEMVNLLLVDAREALSADGQAEFRGIVAPLKASDSIDEIEDAAGAAKRLVEVDRQHRNFGYRLSIWRKAIESAAPGLPIVIIENLEKGNQAAVPCPRCTIVSADDVDKEIFGVFTGRSHPEFEDEQVFLADRAGKLAFEASLSDTSRAKGLAARAKAAVANK